MTTKTYEVTWTDEATTTLLSIRDSQIRSRVLKRAQKLATEPVKQGEPLGYALSGYYSVVAAERYLVIYQVLEDTLTVVVICAGIHRQGERSDAYKVAEKLLQDRISKSNNGHLAESESEQSDEKQTDENA